MKKFASFLVEKRKIFLCAFLLLAAVSLLLAGRVKINYDMTKYLPADSRMKQGMQRMEQEFGPAVSAQLRVMLPGLTEEEKPEIRDALSGLAGGVSVSWDPGEDYNRDGYTLYEIDLESDSHAPEAAALYRAVHEKYGSRGVATGGTVHEANVPLLPLHMVVLAVGLVLLILLIMCGSWFEPVLFLLNIGVAVVINLGINALVPDLSEYTNSIVGIMQLVLSMDYSIILLNRYRQEKEKAASNPEAMKAAVVAAFPAVAGSSLTTFAGLLCLAFMNFRLGMDMGFALARGVLVSLVCIFTVLPSLILMSDRLIVKTEKKALRIPAGRWSRFLVRYRIGFAVLFLALCAGAFLLKGGTEIQYRMPAGDPVEAVFGEKHSIVLLYEKQDSARMAEVLAPFEEDEKVTEIRGYYNTLGKAYRAEEITELFGGGSLADPAMISLVYQLYGLRHGQAGEIVLTPEELISFVSEDLLGNPLFAGMADEDTRRQIEGAGDMIREYASQLEGENYGRVVLTTVYPEDSAETRAFIASLSERCGSLLEGDVWLIGASVMNAEMARTFDAELNRITLLSAAAIFLVVALTFRSLIVPLVLVMTVQCGIYLTLVFIGLSGGGIFYLALLMVQCILMGATVDYAILYTSYYRERRRTGDPAEAVRGAYEGSLHTILTSALIMIAAAGILGFVFANPAIGEICLTISRGAISATLLIVFVLPGVLAALDRFVRPRKKKP